MEEGQSTTEGITRDDVLAALDYLGVHNPKPEIPLEVTLTGHELVGVARRFAILEDRVRMIESMNGVEVTPQGTRLHPR